MKKVLIGVLIFILLIIICVILLDKKQIEEKEVLIVGLDDSFPPMGFRNEENEIVGFDIDIAKAVAEKLNVELKLQPISWDEKNKNLILEI